MKKKEIKKWALTQGSFFLAIFLQVQEKIIEIKLCKHIDKNKECQEKENK